MDKPLTRKQIFHLFEKRQISREKALQLISKLQNQKQRPETSQKKSEGTTTGWQDIAIIGIAGRFPMSDNVAQFWENLKAGRDCISEVPKTRWDMDKYYDPDPKAKDKSCSKWGGFVSDVDRFDSLFFAISPKEAEVMDPQQRLFLQEAWNAFEDAGYANHDLSNKKCGVYVGCIIGDYRQKLNTSQGFGGSNFLIGNIPSLLPARISYFLNLKGPSLNIDTACSSALVATHIACEAIHSGTCEMALVGGVALINSPGYFIGASQAGILSPDGQCRAFDENANGFVNGEAVGAMVIKPASAAIRDGDQI
ncbi:MAG: polyketide synthase, partial [Desulfobacteraceae bacterium]